MSNFRPSLPFTVPAFIIPVTFEKVNGVTVKKDFFSVKISVLDGVRLITVFKNGAISTEPLWIKTKYRSPSSDKWTDGVSRSITGEYRSTYSTVGITYWIGIYADDKATDSLCEVTASDGEVVDTAADNYIFVSAKSYGGTERIVNDKYVIVDTLSVETWFRPDLTSEKFLRLLDDGSVWEIINTPEDINRRHQWLVFKVQRYKGMA